MRRRWIYLTEGRSLVKGPIALANLVDRIQSGDMDPFTIVAPTAEFKDNGLFAYMWPAVVSALAADVPKLCRAWVRNSTRTKKGSRGYWAWLVTCELVEKWPTRGWRVVCKLVDSATGDVLGHVGAGPLEDLIEKQPSYHARIVSRAKRDEKFRQCLRHVRDMHLTKGMREVVGHGVP